VLFDIGNAEFSSDSDNFSGQSEETEEDEASSRLLFMLLQRPTWREEFSKVE
jgi:hypothetical protein